MMKVSEQTLKENSRSKLSNLPNDDFLMIFREGIVTYNFLERITDHDARLKLFAEAIRVYGESNVRYCTVRHAKIEQTVTFA